MHHVSGPDPCLQTVGTPAPLAPAAICPYTWPWTHGPALGTDCSLRRFTHPQTVPKSTSGTAHTKPGGRALKMYLLNPLLPASEGQEAQ